MNARDKTRPSFPFSDLQAQYRALKPQIDARIQRVLDHGQYIMGPEVGELEEALAARTGARHCVAVASGTEALLIALMAVGVEAGDEVITTDFSFAATAEVIALLGAKPVFVDIEADTCNIDVAQIAGRINDRTRAIIPVGLYGQCADMDEINALATRHSLVVIEDAAQSFGASYKGRQSCNLSTVGCTSFFPSKPLGCYGDGGALFTTDDALAQAMREIRVHGQSGRYHHTRVGVGGRMDALQCAIVLAKLERFDWELQRRREIAARYDSLLRGVSGLQTLAQRGECRSAWAQYTVLVERREQVQSALTERGIPTVVHYPKPLHLQPAFAQFGEPDDNPVSRRIAQQVLSLPMSADLDPDDQAETVRQLVGALRARA
ncbi:MAG: DegT/DnrJ/EryC1/StrS family aminotransferase [Ideonella sp.]|nr:MAG: DegT/DnrJ/EryC1/StrS family aminotransferase [Burkholderiaceae bacterium]MBE7426202.1 DegT/DnrJ/EryC1/StrS family aminotransferase [Ideonella sp.]